MVKVPRPSYRKVFGRIGRRPTDAVPATRCKMRGNTIPVKKRTPALRRTGHTAGRIYVQGAIGNQGAHVASADYWKQPEVLEKHAAKRRQKYAADPVLRAAEAARVRSAYARRTGKPQINHAEVALAAITGPVTPAQLSVLMNRRPYYMSRMISEGRWPRPDAHGEYTEAQARRLMTVFAEHERTCSTLRKEHTFTLKKLRLAMQVDVQL